MIHYIHIFQNENNLRVSENIFISPQHPSPFRLIKSFLQLTNHSPLRRNSSFTQTQNANANSLTLTKNLKSVRIIFNKWTTKKKIISVHTIMRKNASHRQFNIRISSDYDNYCTIKPHLYTSQRRTLMVIVLGTHFGNYTVSPYYCIYIHR